MGTIRPVAPKKRSESKPDPLQYIVTADKVKKITDLIKHMCTLPIRPGCAPDAEVCRKCESKCAFGRKYVNLWDDELLEGRDPAQTFKQAIYQKERKPMPTVKKPCSEVTMQEQLEIKLAENADLQKTIISLTEQRDKYAEELKAKERECMALQAIAEKMEASLMRIKAWALDKIHPEIASY